MKIQIIIILIKLFFVIKLLNYFLSKFNILYNIKMSKLRFSKSKDESQDKINFYDICKIEKTENDGEIKFTLEDGKTTITSDCICIADPSYDCVFKTIFGEGNKCLGIDGNARLLNLLNSLIFPNKMINILSRLFL